MTDSAIVLVVHPESRMRLLLRSVLQDHGRTVLTEHSWSDLLSDRPGAVPAVILLDRSFVALEGVDALALLRGKWPGADIVVLPESLENADTWRDSMIDLLHHMATGG